MPWSSGLNQGTLYNNNDMLDGHGKMMRYSHYKLSEKLIMLFLGYLSLPTLIDKIMAQVIKIVRDGGWGAITLTVHAGLSHQPTSLLTLVAKSCSKTTKLEAR